MEGGQPSQPYQNIGSPKTETSALPASSVPQSIPSASLISPLDSPEATKNSTLPQTQTPSSVPKLPDANAYHWQLVTSGLDRPVGISYTGSEDKRLYIIEQAGLIRVVEGGVLLKEPFLDIRDRVGNQGSEQGLLGLAFHPRYPAAPYFYVDYTNLAGNSVISRFSQASDQPGLADAASEKIYLTIEQPFANHNGGEVVFGPEGYLYLGLGDGGSGGDPMGNAQSTQSLLGKILRIDIDSGDPYAVPADNPFVNGNGSPEIWAYGLRNPWRFSFDRLGGGLFIGDVGQDAWEEVDYLPAISQGGANFGWNFKEGNHAYQGSPPLNMQLDDPIFEYDHRQGCSITGGVVYRGLDLTDWQGVYLFGDYCSGSVWGLLNLSNSAWQARHLFETNARITSFGENAAGDVYLADYQGGIFVLAKKP